MRLIDADELIEHVWRDRLDSRERIANLVESMPTIKPQRIKGHWIKKMTATGSNGDIIYRPEWYCSQCRSIYDPIMSQRINFCCVCGADMRGDEK